jgi:Flp pilus assembly protein TadG
MSNRLLAGIKSERGQSFMELAISLLFLMVLLCVVIDLGWAFYSMVALRDTAQEAASFGAMCPDEINDGNVNTNRVYNRLLQSATSPINISDLTTGGGQIEICAVPATGAQPAIFSCPQTTSPVRGNNVRVSLQIQHKIMTPFVGAFIGTQTYPLMVTVSNVILVDHCPSGIE